MNKNQKAGLFVLGGLVVLGTGIVLATRKAGAAPPPPPPPESPPFNFGIPVVNGYQVPDMLEGLMYPHVSVLITNNNDEVVTHTIHTYMDYYAQPWAADLIYDDRLCVPSEEVITLEPGQSYQYEFDGASAQNWLYHNYADLFVMDELGHRSEMTRLTS